MNPARSKDAAGPGSSQVMAGYSYIFLSSFLHGHWGSGRLVDKQAGEVTTSSAKLCGAHMHNAITRLIPLEASKCINVVANLVSDRGRDQPQQRRRPQSSPKNAVLNF